MTTLANAIREAAARLPGDEARLEAELLLVGGGAGAEAGFEAAQQVRDRLLKDMAPAILDTMARKNPGVCAGELRGRLAELLNVQQPSIAKLEKRTDMYVSNLRRFVQAMGGELHVVARFPEGDWLLLGRQKREEDPSPIAVEGMIAWMKIRQLAVDNARAAVAHKDVAVYHYIEVNLVKKAMAGRASIALSVLPEANPDLVSYSAYEAIKQSPQPDLMSIRQPLEQILAYLEGQLPPKDGLPFKRRVFIGEYGYHADKSKPLTVKQQYMKSRFVMQSAVALDLPFALIWQMYNNEYAENGTSKEMSLIDESGRKRALYALHQTYLGEMQAFVAASCRDTGTVPSRDAFRARAIELLKPGMSSDKIALAMATVMLIGPLVALPIGLG